MIFGSWNIRGLNRPFKQKELKTFLLKNKVSLLGCLETKIKQDKVRKVRKNLGTEWEVFADYSQEPNGRIWVLWNDQQVQVTILQSNPQMVHCSVKDRNSDFSCQMTFIYGLNLAAGRKDIWNHIRNMSPMINVPWILLGDFNTILSVHDRVNGLPVQQGEITDFQDCIQDAGLGQLNRKGCQFSWSNKRDAEVRIYSLIDWAFGNDLWFMAYSSLEAHYYNPHCSDHSPILIRTKVDRYQLPKPYRMLNVLLVYEPLRRADFDNWGKKITGHAMFRVWQKLKGIQQDTKQMNKAMSSLDGKLANLQGLVARNQEELENDLFNPQLIREERELISQLEYWSHIHERVLRQRSKVTWIAHGDSNTKYFHASLKARQAKNRISSICNEQGLLLTDPQLVQQEFTQFFRGLLGTSAEELPCIDIRIARDGPCLNYDQQQLLMQLVTSQEVRETLKSSFTDKSHRVDGFPANFSKRYGTR
ncbi:uncharacterized protein LOC132065978 [Lycium ferocissimum]|uniref:uncharacterized protein LOC132065978 n=1 Tax=Lycium ferocissimum TaxID=112874 RepID=UPI002814FA4C|nr:uncharacterized protein LOC132065978 [Lycium ferocissimum]